MYRNYHYYEKLIKFYTFVNIVNKIILFIEKNFNI